MRVQLTIRVEPHTADYVVTVAEQATRASGVRMTVNAAAAALLERAEAEGWTVTAGRTQTSRPGAPLTIPTPGRDSSQHQEG